MDANPAQRRAAPTLCRSSMMDVEMDLGEIGGEGVQEVEKDQWADLVDDNRIPSNQKTSRSWQALNLTWMTNLKQS